jgi:hypothetical protein
VEFKCGVPQIPGQWTCAPMVGSGFHRLGGQIYTLATGQVCGFVWEVTVTPGPQLRWSWSPLCPAGPAESLFKESYYQLMKTALKEDGILCCQGE